MELSDSAPPLRQDGIEELLQYQAKVNQSIKSSKCPFSVIELNAFLQQNNITLAQCLGIVDSQLDRDMLASDFFSKLQSKNFVPKSQPTMEADLREATTKRDQVSLSLLKTHLRTLNPVNGVGSLNEAN